jgi:hypothetical protein
MPSTGAFLDPNIVQPTKYVVPPIRIAKELPPEPWQLPKFEPFVRASYSLSRLQDPSDLIGWSLSIRIGPETTLQGITLSCLIDFYYFIYVPTFRALYFYFSSIKRPLVILVYFLLYIEGLELYIL